MSGVTTGNLSGQENPKRLNIGSKNHINHLENDNYIMNQALLQFEKEKQENGYAKFKDVFEKVQANYKK